VKEGGGKKRERVSEKERVRKKGGEREGTKKIGRGRERGEY